MGWVPPVRLFAPPSAAAHRPPSTPPARADQRQGRAPKGKDQPRPLIAKALPTTMRSPCLYYYE